MICSLRIFIEDFALNIKRHMFVKNQQNLPLGDKYSEIITESGMYRIVIEIFDTGYNESLSYVGIITVK